MTKLKQLGFNMSNRNFGTIEPEAYDVGKNHFKPEFRTVFVGKAKGGYYVTSHITGSMRYYRHQYSNTVDIANIFGYGNTRNEAIDSFVSKFESKTYNRISL